MTDLLNRCRMRAEVVRGTLRAVETGQVPPREVPRECGTAVEVLDLMIADLKAAELGTLCQRLLLTQQLALSAAMADRLGMGRPDLAEALGAADAVAATVPPARWAYQDTRAAPDAGRVAPDHVVTDGHVPPAAVPLVSDVRPFGDAPPLDDVIQRVWANQTRNGQGGS